MRSSKLCAPKQGPIRHESLHPSPLEALTTQDDVTRALESNIPEPLVQYQTLFSKQLSQSYFFKNVPRKPIPSFSRGDLTIGSRLGMGGFCVVREVTAIHSLMINDDPMEQSDDNNREASGEYDDEEEDQIHQTRLYMTENVYRDNKARYAIKHLRKDLSKTDNGASHYRGMVDLALEAQFLSHVHHPNIIRMRGVLTCTNPVYTEGYFLVLDRLYGTLEEVIEGRWKEEQKQNSKFWGLKKKDKEQMRLLFQERLIVAYDVSSVFRYLHQNRIVYRDIKSENIGFDIRVSQIQEEIENV